MQGRTSGASPRGPTRNSDPLLAFKTCWFRPTLKRTIVLYPERLASGYQVHRLLSSFVYAF